MPTVVTVDLEAENQRLKETLAAQEGRIAVLSGGREELLRGYWYWKARCLASEHLADSLSALPVSEISDLDGSPVDTDPDASDEDGQRGCLAFETPSRLWIHTPLRIFPIPPSAVAAIRALPGDTVSWEVRIEEGIASCTAFPFFSIHESAPRTYELTHVVDRWLVRTQVGDLPLLAPRCIPAPGTPVSIFYNPEVPAYAVLDRVLPWRVAARERPVAKAARTVRPPKLPTPAAAKSTLLEGLRLCVCGGEGFIALYRAVVEKYGARFVYGGSFADVSRTERSVKRADAVIFVAGGISHKLFQVARTVLKNKPCFYSNSLGCSALEKVIVEQVAPALLGSGR